MHAAHGCARILIRGRGYRAGIENDNFCVGRFCSAFQPALLELAFERGSVSLSGPATKILYVESRHSTIVATFEGKMSRGPPLEAASTSTPRRVSSKT